MCNPGGQVQLSLRPFSYLVAAHMRTTIPCLFMLGLCFMSGIAQATSIKTLVLEAFDSQDGRAHGYLSGPSAEPIRIMTKGEAPTELTVNILKRYDQQCGYVRLSFMQPDALRRDGQRERLDYHMDTNICRNGMPYVPPEMRDGPRTLASAPVMQQAVNMPDMRIRANVEPTKSAPRANEKPSGSKPTEAKQKRNPRPSSQQGQGTKKPSAP